MSNDRFEPHDDPAGKGSSDRPDGTHLADTHDRNGRAERRRQASRHRTDSLDVHADQLAEQLAEIERHLRKAHGTTPVHTDALLRVARSARNELRTLRHAVGDPADAAGHRRTERELRALATRVDQLERVAALTTSADRLANRIGARTGSMTTGTVTTGSVTTGSVTTGQSDEDQSTADALRDAVDDVTAGLAGPVPERELARRVRRLRAAHGAAALVYAHLVAG